MRKTLLVRCLHPGRKTLVNHLKINKNLATQFLPFFSLSFVFFYISPPLVCIFCFWVRHRQLSSSGVLCMCVFVRNVTNENLGEVKNCDTTGEVAMGLRPERKEWVKRTPKPSYSQETNCKTKPKPQDTPKESNCKIWRAWAPPRSSKWTLSLAQGPNGFWGCMRPSAAQFKSNFLSLPFWFSGHNGGIPLLVRNVDFLFLLWMKTDWKKIVCYISGFAFPPHPQKKAQLKKPKFDAILVVVFRWRDKLSVQNLVMQIQILDWEPGENKEIFLKNKLINQVILFPTSAQNCCIFFFKCRGELGGALTFRGRSSNTQEF